MEIFEPAVDIAIWKWVDAIYRFRTGGIEWHPDQLFGTLCFHGTNECLLSLFCNIRNNCVPHFGISFSQRLWFISLIVGPKVLSIDWVCSCL